MVPQQVNFGVTKLSLVRLRRRSRFKQVITWPFEIYHLELTDPPQQTLWRRWYLWWTLCPGRLLEVLKPTTDSETLSKDPKWVFCSVRSNHDQFQPWELVHNHIRRWEPICIGQFDLYLTVHERFMPKWWGNIQLWLKFHCIQRLLHWQRWRILAPVV